MSNAISFHGRLTKDAEVQATANGKTLCRFTVASDVGYGDYKSTNFFDVVIFGKRAEGGLPPLLKKGTSVYVSGELKIEKREYEGKHYTNVTVLNPNAVDLIGGKSQSGNDRSQGGNSNDGQKAAVAGQEFSDDIPFLSMRGEW